MKHLFATLIFLVAFAEQTSAAIWYVKPNGSDANTGDSWASAFQNVQKAINSSTDGDEIWVAEGTYLPTTKVVGTTERHKAFFLFYNMKRLCCNGVIELRKRLVCVNFEFSKTQKLRT